MALVAFEHWHYRLEAFQAVCGCKYLGAVLFAEFEKTLPHFHMCRVMDSVFYFINQHYSLTVSGDAQQNRQDFMKSGRDGRNWHFLSNPRHFAIEHSYAGVKFD